jgi:hypothetical protein
MTDEKAPPAEVDPVTKQANIDKAVADARTSEATAGKTEAELADLESPSGRASREAKNVQATAEAHQKAAEARQSELTAMVPDISKVTNSTLELGKDGPAIHASALTFGAVGEAAQAIANAILNPDTGAKRILVTSDDDLVTTDAVWWEVTTGLAQLEKAASDLLIDATVESVETAALAPIITAAAAALPSVISLLSAQRSISTASVTVNDLAAATAVAGALEAQGHDRVVVVHDDFRLLGSGRVQTAANGVAGKRNELVARKLAISDRRTAFDTELTIAKADLASAEKAFADADHKKPHPDLDAAIDNAQKAVAGLTRKVDAATTRLGSIDSVLAAIDAFTAAIRVVPAGGRRSPLATAMLRDDMHAGSPSWFSHVLLIKSQPAQSAQLTDDKPLWFKDKFSTLVEVNVTYMLISTDDSHVDRAGTATAMKSAHGDLGSQFHFDTESNVAGVYVPDDRSVVGASNGNN